MKSNQIVLDIAWFKRDQWEIMKSVCIDSDHLQDTYKEWETNASRIVADLERQRKLVNKVVIDIHKFIEWCDKNNMPRDGGSRARYAASFGQMERTGESGLEFLRNHRARPPFNMTQGDEAEGPV